MKSTLEDGALLCVDCDWNSKINKPSDRPVTQHCIDGAAQGHFNEMCCNVGGVGIDPASYRAAGQLQWRPSVIKGTEQRWLVGVKPSTNVSTSRVNKEEPLCFTRMNIRCVSGSVGWTGCCHTDIKSVCGGSGLYLLHLCDSSIMMNIVCSSDSTEGKKRQ